jgi:hypothetical protein
MEVSGQLHASVVLPLGKKKPYQLDRRLGGPKNWSGHGFEEKNSQPRRESNPDHATVQPVASSYIEMAIPALKPKCSCFQNESYYY